MEYNRRRGRRGRGRPRTNPQLPVHTFTPPRQEKTWSFLSAFYSFFIMISLIAVVYLMLEYHCSSYNAKCGLDEITKNIDDITKNLSVLKTSCHELETKILTFSQDLPKIGQQIVTLEAMAKGTNEFGWTPNSQSTMPSNVDFVNRCLKNESNYLSKRS